MPSISSDTLSLLVIALVLLLVIGAFIRISIKVRRGGGSLTTLVLGSTDEFLTKEKSKAAEIIVNRNAGKEFESQASEDCGPGSNGVPGVHGQTE